MATSGTVGLETIKVIDLIDHSILRCGIEPAKITAQMLQTAKRNVFLYVSSLANRGINLWTIERSLIGLYPYQAIYQLPVGTIDVLNVNYKQVSRWSGVGVSSAGGTSQFAFDGDVDTACTQVSTNGNISADMGSAQVITEVAVMTNGNQSYNLVFESSEDNITWTTVLAVGAASYLDKKWAWYQVTMPQSGRYFRVRETGGGTLNIRELVFGKDPNEIPVTRNNRDDYSNLPNKTTTGPVPTQFWYNRIIPQPEIFLWPVPLDTFVSLVVWRHRQIQDIGDLTNELEVPQRWYECMLANVAARNSLDIPDVDPSRITMLGQLAQSAEEPPHEEERDKAPSTWTPNISYYTR